MVCRSKQRIAGAAAAVGLLATLACAPTAFQTVAPPNAAPLVHGGAAVAQYAPSIAGLRASPAATGSSTLRAAAGAGCAAVLCAVAAEALRGSAKTSKKTGAVRVTAVHAQQAAVWTAPTVKLPATPTPTVVVEKTPAAPAALVSDLLGEAVPIAAAVRAPLLVQAPLEAPAPVSVAAAAEVPRACSAPAAGRSARFVGGSRRSNSRSTSQGRAEASRARRNAGAKLMEPVATPVSTSPSYDPSSLRTKIQLGLRTPSSHPRSEKGREPRTMATNDSVCMNTDSCVAGYSFSEERTS